MDHIFSDIQYSTAENIFQWLSLSEELSMLYNTSGDDEPLSGISNNDDKSYNT